MRANRESARFLAWAAIAAQPVFIAAWIVSAALQPGYSVLNQGVSEAGAGNAAHPWIINAGLVLVGLSFVAAGVALLAALPRRPARTIAAGLFIASGIAFALTGVLNLDCGMAVDQRCEDLWHAGRLSWQHDAHLWAGFASELLFVLTPFAIGRALWPSPVAAAALTSGVFGAVYWLVTGFGLGHAEGVAEGLVQRIGLGVMQLWVLIVAGGVLWATRGEREPGALIPIRPRDFFAREWTGEGEIVLWPWFLGRRLGGRRFGIVRKATWLSDRIWRFDDEARYPTGRVERRRTYCEFVGDDRLRLTAGDLPAGADVRLEEGGYRITPWRMNWPIGPVPIPIRCHDISRVAPDGTFVNVIEARTLVFGLPVAQTRFYVRPTDADGAGPAPERQAAAAP